MPHSAFNSLNNCLPKYYTTQRVLKDNFVTSFCAKRCNKSPLYVDKSVLLQSSMFMETCVKALLNFKKGIIISHFSTLVLIDRSCDFGYKILWSFYFKSRQGCRCLGGTFNNLWL